VVRRFGIISYLEGSAVCELFHSLETLSRIDTYLLLLLLLWSLSRNVCCKSRLNNRSLLTFMSSSTDSHQYQTVSSTNIRLNLGKHRGNGVIGWIWEESSLSSGPPREHQGPWVSLLRNVWNFKCKIRPVFICLSGVVYFGVVWCTF